MATLLQRSFAGGELSPELRSRPDLVKFTYGAGRIYNAFVKRSGGVMNRGGTKMVTEAISQTVKGRLIPFIYNSEQTYPLEFGALGGSGLGHIRVLKNGAIQNSLISAVSGITLANPAVATTSAPHGLTDNQEVFFESVVGMPEIVGRKFRVDVLTTTTFSLKYPNGTAVNSTGFGAFTSGNLYQAYGIHASYDDEDRIAGIDYTQSADVMTLVQELYAPAQLSRLGDTNWTLADMNFEPTSARPTGGGSSGSGSGLHYYVVTAIDKDTGEESLPGFETAKNITGITQANPAVVTSAAHTHVAGETVFIDGVVGMTEINGRFYKVAAPTANTYQLVGVDSTTYGAYVSGGTSQRPYIRAPFALAAGTPITITWNSVTNAREYNIYGNDNGIYGLIGISGGTSFVDPDITPDFTETPPFLRDLFNSANNYPSVVSYYQQRLVFAGSIAEPETVYPSAIGHYKNFTTRSPIQDDDAFRFPVVGQHVNRIRHMRDFGRLVFFTEGGEHGAEAEVLTPTNVGLKRYSSNGASKVRPIEAEGTLLYVQERGSQVRFLRYDQSTDNLAGDDLTDFAKHLFENRIIEGWAYQKNPHSIVWAVMSDGKVCSMTFIPSQEIVAWSHHDFGGVVEDVCTVPEGNTDAVYFIIKRTFGENTYRFIERLDERYKEDQIDYCFMDCAKTYDGRNELRVEAPSSLYVTLTGGTTWTMGESMNLEAYFEFGADLFSAEDLDKEIHLYLADGEVLKLEIDSVTDGLNLVVKPKRDVPVDFQNVAIVDFRRAAKTIKGLWHLEGQEVSVLADGLVLSSPNNPEYEGSVLTVANGEIELDYHYGVVHVGLPFISDLETLGIDLSAAGQPSNRKSNIGRTFMRFQRTRGVWVGPERPDDDESATEGLIQFKPMADGAAYDGPPPLKNGKYEITFKRKWSQDGHVLARQVDPLPMEIDAVELTGYVPGGG